MATDDSEPESTGVTPTHDSPTGGVRRAADALAGHVIADRYRVERTASVGAHTVIVDARDIELGRLVTVKLIRPEFSEAADFQRRFDQTMHAMSGLSHPNIAAIHDWGVTTLSRRGTCYVVVEYLNAGSLRELFDRGRYLAPSQALVVGLEACRALDYAHRRSVVHSEITPSKLVFGEDRRLRVIDFGLARLLGMAAWSEPSTLPTHTAQYASPEQAQRQPLDGKTDVFALALTLVEAVTGRVPFAADSTAATLAGRVGKLMPVSADLGSLAAVLERAGRPDREDRWTAAEFGRALVRAAEQLPRPEPLPLIVNTLFTESPLRQPSDPTGGLQRPPEVAHDVPDDDAPTPDAAPPSPAPPSPPPPSPAPAGLPGEPLAAPPPDAVAATPAPEIDTPEPEVPEPAAAEAAPSDESVADDAGAEPSEGEASGEPVGEPAPEPAGEMVQDGETGQDHEQVTAPSAGAAASEASDARGEPPAVEPIDEGGPAEEHPPVALGEVQLAAAGSDAPSDDASSDDAPRSHANGDAGDVAAKSASAAPVLYDGEDDVTRDELAHLAVAGDQAAAEEDVSSSALDPLLPSAAGPALDVPGPLSTADGGEGGGDDAADRTGGRRWWPRALVAALLLIALVGVGVTGYLLFRAERHEVPELTGLSEEDAHLLVEEYDWEIDTRLDRSDEVPDEGNVIRTEPAAGEQLAEGGQFLLIVSEGPEFRELPELREMTRDDALGRLESLQLAGSVANRVFDEEVSPGEVVRWRVADDPELGFGDQVLPDTEIELVMSKGPEPREVPDLRGMTPQEARAELDDLRLGMDRGERVFHESIDEGSVAQQRPRPGAEIERDETVTIRVSKGPDLVEFPDLDGLGERRARQRLRNAGFELADMRGAVRQGEFERAMVANTHDSPGDDCESGSNIQPGTECVRGTPIVLVYIIS